MPTLKMMDLDKVINVLENLESLLVNSQNELHSKILKDIRFCIEEIID